MSNYYVGNIGFDPNYLEHYGRRGMHPGEHLPDIKNPYAPLKGKRSAIHKMDKNAIKKTLEIMSNPYRAKNNNRPISRQKMITDDSYGIDEGPYDPVHRDYRKLGSVMPAGGGNAGSNTHASVNLQREARLREEYDAPHRKPLKLIESDKHKTQRIKRQMKNAYNF